jgi:DNA-binding GntR family transcriptional regulator
MKEVSATLFGNVDNRLLFESVADILRRSILRGDFSPGERLNEVVVARVLNVSRGPIREALRQLEQEGIVNLYPQRGGRVANVSKREVIAALAIRELLETMAAEETCKAITDGNISQLRELADGNISQLRELITEMERAEAETDFVCLVYLDFQFHRELLTIASTDTALRTWTLLGGKLMLFQSIGNRRYLVSRSVSASHIPIIEALAERNPEQFRKVILAHIEENRQSIG